MTHNKQFDDNKTKQIDLSIKEHSNAIDLLITNNTTEQYIGLAHLFNNGFKVVQIFDAIVRTCIHNFNKTYSNIESDIKINNTSRKHCISLGDTIEFSLIPERDIPEFIELHINHQINATNTHTLTEIEIEITSGDFFGMNRFNNNLISDVFAVSDDPITLSTIYKAMISESDFAYNRRLSIHSDKILQAILSYFEFLFPEHSKLFER